MLKEDVQKTGSTFIYSEEMCWFDFGPNHPYKPERAAKAYDLCNRYGVMNRPWMSIVEPEAIETSLLQLFHDTEYIKILSEASRGNVSLEILESGLGTEDNPILKGIYEWSLKAAGGTHLSMSRILEGKALVAFNPLGGFHHAMPAHAEGFCYINDIAIAIKYALNISPDIRIAYIDLDAHHGNGVQEAFYNDQDVLFISLHQSGKSIYPGSGSETDIGGGDGAGYTVNVPLEPGTDDEVYEFVFDSVVMPIVRAFSPDLAVAELGADILVSDPLTGLKLTNNGYQKAVKGIMSLCPRILSLGGGGYDLYRTARCWTLAWSILNGVEPVDEFAGLVGGMMFGPEMEVGSLYDNPYSTTGETKKKALEEARRVTSYIREKIFPIHGI